MTAPNDTDARLTVIEHYLAIVIAGQLSDHDDALAQLEAEDLGWQAQLAGSEAAIRARFDALDPRPPPKRIESDIAALSCAGWNKSGPRGVRSATRAGTWRVRCSRMRFKRAPMSAQRAR